MSILISSAAIYRAPILPTSLNWTKFNSKRLSTPLNCSKTSTNPGFRCLQLFQTEPTQTTVNGSSKSFWSAFGNKAVTCLPKDRPASLKIDLLNSSPESADSHNFSQSPVEKKIFNLYKNV